MRLYFYYNDFATGSLKFHISDTKYAPRTFLRTCTIDMLHAYSKAMELVMHRQSPEESVNTEDNDHEWLGRLTLECKGEQARIYTEYGSSTLATGEEQVDVTVPVRNLYHEMHEFHVFVTGIRNAFKADRRRVFGMDLSKNFDSIENARYFNTENGESGMVTDIPEGRAWLELELRKRV